MTEIDLLIQDFVSTNKLVNQNIPWDTLVSRRFENGRRKIFRYGGSKIAEAEHVDMADGEWLIVKLLYPIDDTVDVSTLRFDCLKMMHALTHYEMSVEKEEGGIVVRLRTRNRGLMNVMFRCGQLGSM
jgi:hypothetical protein